MKRKVKEIQNDRPTVKTITNAAYVTGSNQYRDFVCKFPQPFTQLPTCVCGMEISGDRHTDAMALGIQKVTVTKVTTEAVTIRVFHAGDKAYPGTQVNIIAIA